MLKINNLNWQKLKYIVLTCCFLLLFSGAVSARYTLEADEIIFREADSLILFEGNASFRAEEYTIQADKLLLDTEARLLKGESNIIISSDKEELYGESLEYNYEEQSGSLYRAEGSLEEIYFSGARLEIIAASPFEGKLTEAEFTPCKREDPHYHFKAREIRINPDNTLSIYHIVPHVAGIPVFYLPYYSVTYDPEGEAGETLSDTIPFPQFGYEQGTGITVEMSYPYQISDSNSGKIYYYRAGDEEERREFSNVHRLTDNLNLINRYNYLYEYDSDADVIDEEEEEYTLSLEYSIPGFSVEGGYLRNLLVEDNRDRYYITSSYLHKSGVNTYFRQEYDSEELIKENYRLSYNRGPVPWNLRYVDGESYNYYPYLHLNLPRVLNFNPYLAFGRVENAGIELNKYRAGLNFSYNFDLTDSVRYHFRHNYRLDHYKSGFDQNYHYFNLRTGLSYRGNPAERLSVNSSLFYEEKLSSGSSPLPDDREDDERLLKPALSFELAGELPESAWAIDADGSYNLDTEEWDEINLRIRKKEDCFDFFIGYEFIDEALIFGLEL
ncbi:LPS-assembly protein LptD [Halanaerobium hydrogeniformans]|uniref:OstA family protein n=1 Tax=Halanaerobium hydrogeniformans TaxID=656519 RepID=E4RPN6_HALHG|nr:LPS-assembly protein LptD [Halanaerobium hydrogeniformans]ADQ13920.1 hypothetical protein Halsa_0447 [Halanaerobium hydrogeniformans]